MYISREVRFWVIAVLGLCLAFALIPLDAPPGVNFVWGFVVGSVTLRLLAIYG